MTTAAPARPLTALAVARDKALYDLDAKPERWTPGPPFDALDIRPRRVLLLGAPPGVGKTTLSLQLMTDLIARHSLRAVVANVETAPPVLLDKLLARLAGVDLTALMNRELTASERKRIDAALDEHADTLDRLAFHRERFNIRALFETMQTFDARLAVVDYVQRFAASEQEQRAMLDEVMSQVRILADVGAAVLVISSVARQKDNNGSSTYSGLSLAAFRGSAELEFGADSAYLLALDKGSGVARLECVKNRFGAEHSIPLRFCGPFQRFEAGDPLDGFDAAPGPLTPEGAK